MTDKKQNPFDRLYLAAECRTQMELAELFKIRQSSISDAKRRNSIPPEWLLKLLKKKGINPDWIYDGKSVKYLVPVDSVTNMPHIVRVVEIRPPAECSAQELINELVRRALEKPDIEEIQKEVANNWLPVKKVDGES